MTRRLSKEDFEATFDAFLKTSVSSEDDTEKINELLANPKHARRKDPGLWWLDDDDKKKGSSTPAKKSFMKAKKTESSGKSSGKIKASDIHGSSRSPRGKSSKHTIIKKGKPDRGKGGRETSPGKGKGSRGRGPSDMSMSKDSLEDISEKSEEHEHHGHRSAFAPAPTSSFETTRESVTTDGAGSLVDSDKSPGKPGFDTLDELAEKQRFFQDLENKANGSLDYSQLNRELSATGTMFSPGTAKGILAGISDESPDSSQDRPPPALPISALCPAEPDVSIDMDPSSHQKPSMLSKVSLLDSLDSTLNTTTSPQAAVRNSSAVSRDTTQENLGQTLPETLKTQGTAGAMGTNTSREIEELHQALREVGMSATLKGAESKNASGREQAADSLMSRKPTDRSVGQLLKEMDEITERQRAMDAEENDVKLMSDYKSPRSPRSPGLHRQGNVEDQEQGFDNSHTEDTEVYQPVTAVSVSEKSMKSSKKKVEKSSSTPNAHTLEERGRRSSRDRYSHVQSSGYGKRSPEVTPRKSPSPSVSPIRPVAPGRLTHASLDSARTSRKGSLSPSPRRPKFDSRRPSQTQVLHSRSAVQPGAFQDREEPIVSKYSRTGVSGIREDVLIEELKDLRLQLQEERQKVTRLLADKATQERETLRQTETLRLDYEEQIFKLKQENFVLSARLKDLEADGKVGSETSSGRGEAPSAESFARLEKECKEQEELLARFQAENKRLYEDVRARERAGKQTEEAMFKENQRLKAEVTSVRSLLDQKETELRSKGIITSLAAQQQIASGNSDSVADVARTAHLEADLREAKRQHENSLRELKALQQSRTELEQHVDALVMEREMIRKQLNAARQARPEEIKSLEQKHKEETDRLNRKLKWYAENQELLDKSSRTIKAKEEEITKLKLRIEELHSETGKRMEENKLKSKQRATDAKKIQDLERQVKEMEQIIRRRYPNSLPALMLAAAAAPDSALQTAEDSRSRTVDVLEKRIRKLEGELEKKDDEAATLLRGMEQKFNAVKFQYEERAADLEAQLRLYKRQGDGDSKPYEHPHTHAIALERELDSTRERYKKQITELTTQVEKLTTELTKLRKQQDNSHRADQSRWQQVEADLRAQVSALQASNEEKDKDLRTVMATADRMQKNSGRGKGKGGGDENYGSTGLNTFPDQGQRAPQQKEYNPDIFADHNTSEILRENAELKSRLELLQLDRDQQRVELRRSLAETESTARQSREDYESKIETMRDAHEKELTRLKAEQAVYNSTSKLASLQSRCDSQEVMVQHLQRRLAQRDAELDQLSGVRKREAELSQQVEAVQAKLREAKRSHAPEMRHYEALEEKICQLSERSSKREQQMDALVKSSQRMSSHDLAEEAAKWKRMVETKNLEICHFRQELDSILAVLRELQRQGVTLPYVVPANS